MRKTIFANGEYYHIYNRGVDKREVFLDDFDYIRFLESIREFNNEIPSGGLYEKYLKNKKLEARGSTSIMEVEPLAHPLVEIICYCLNPNHFHLVLKQVSDSGISEFMRRLGGGYTYYFNKKYERSGSLFQGRFKSIYIDTNEYLLHLSAYVNKNNFIHGYNKNDDWQYSSYLDYIGKRDGELCSKEAILGQFKNKKEYGDFMEKTATYLKDKKEIQKYLLD